MCISVYVCVCVCISYGKKLNATLPFSLGTVQEGVYGAFGRPRGPGPFWLHGDLVLWGDAYLWRLVLCG